MNSNLGCREKANQEWRYLLKDGTSIGKEEWSRLIRLQISKNNHEAVFENVKSIVNLWNKQDTIDEVALQVYASKYCERLEHISKIPNGINVVKDEMGCNQLSFY